MAGFPHVVDKLIGLYTPPTQNKYPLYCVFGVAQSQFPVKSKARLATTKVVSSNDWEQRKLGEVAVISTGATPRTDNAAFWFPKEIAWLSSGEINKRRIQSTNDRISQLGFDSASTHWIPARSVLIALAGQGKTRGKVAISEIPLCTNQSIAAVSPGKSTDSEFLFQNLGSRYNELRLMSTGSGSRGGLSKQIIGSVFIRDHGRFSGLNYDD